MKRVRKIILIGVTLYVLFFSLSLINNISASRTIVNYPNVVFYKAKTTKKVKYKEKDVINYAKSTYEEAKTSKKIKKSLKSSFITLVDFIFYDGEIKGYTFSSLSTSAKTKVLYYTLKADNCIEKKFPKYKETISSYYIDLKEKLIAEYMDTLNSLCEIDASKCKTAKKDFNNVKKELKLTWKSISSSLKYSAGKVKESLKNWYELFKASE